jgi:hypothetical protein
MEQTWTEEELRDLILFAQSLREENEDLRAKVIAMDAMLKNEMAKVKNLSLQIKQLIYANSNITIYPN